MVKRYKRIIYTFKNSIEVYEYLDGKYGAPGKKRGKKRKLTEEAIRYRNQWNRERKVRHKLKTWFKKNDYMVLLTYKKNERPPDMDTAKKRSVEGNAPGKGEIQKSRTNYAVDGEYRSRDQRSMARTYSHKPDSGCRRIHKRRLGAWSRDL